MSRYRIRLCAALIRLVIWIDPNFMPILTMEAHKLILAKNAARRGSTE